jgi:heptosyltransferase-2
MIPQMRHLALVQPRVGIGDMIWHLPHIRALARHVAGRVTLVTRPRSMADQFVGPEDGVHDILYVERGQWSPGGRHEGNAGMLRLVRDLRALRCDGAVLMTRSRNLTLAVLAMGVRHRHGYGIGVQRRVLQGPFLPRSLWKAHPYDQATAWMEAAGIALDRPDPVVHVSEADRLAAALRLGAGGTPVALGIASSDDWKNWGAANFAALAAALLDAGWPDIVLVGGTAEQGMASAITARLGARAGQVRLALGWRLRELAALLAGAAFYIGNDTAALNMAAAVGTRSYGLFGATMPLRHSPLIVPVLPPGGLDRAHGMAGITPAAVLQAISGEDRSKPPR